jgi:hypothetical protein
MSKYSPGQSGNPSGRKAGSLNKRTQLAKMLEPHAKDLIDKTVELALAGDINALRLCVERLIPKAKDEVPKVLLPDFNTLGPKEIRTAILRLFSAQEVSIQDLKYVTSFALQAIVEEGGALKTEEEIREMAELMKKYEREY